MKSYAKYLAVALLLVSTSVLGQTNSNPTCSIDPNLSSADAIKQFEACKQRASSTSETPEQTLARMSAYSEIAQGVAEAIGTAAQELGMAVDEFIGTDAGKITVALVVWHVAGDDIIGIVLGVPMFLLALFMFFIMERRARFTGDYHQIKYTTWYGRDKTKQTKVYKEYDSLNNSAGGTIVISGFVFGVLAIVSLNLIF